MMLPSFLRRLTPSFALGVALLLALPAAAQAPDLGFQVGFGRSRPAALDLASASGSLSVDPANQQGLTLRGFAAWHPAPAWNLEASLGWRGRSEGGLDFRSSAAGAGRLDTRLALRSQLILGGLAGREFPLGRLTGSASGGFDLRAESLAAETARGSSTATLHRPWFRAALRVSWPGAGRPFLALEYAAPLTRPSTAAADYLQDLDHLDLPPNPAAGTAAKAHAPASELLLAFGMRMGR